MTKEKPINGVLSEIQKSLKVPKQRENKFGGYKYRNCEDILDAVKAIMPEGATLTIDDEPVMVGDWHYMKAVAEFSYGGESVVTSGFAREALSKKGMDEAQITGSASSYARKSALNGLFCIDDSRDPDETNTHGKEEKHQASDAQRKAKAKAWVADFAEKMSLIDNQDAFVDLMAKTGEHRTRIAKGYPDLLVSIDKAIQAAEGRLRGEEVLDDEIPY